MTDERINMDALARGGEDARRHLGDKKGTTWVGTLRAGIECAIRTALAENEGKIRAEEANENLRLCLHESDEHVKILRAENERLQLRVQDAEENRDNALDREQRANDYGDKVDAQAHDLAVALRQLNYQSTQLWAYCASPHDAPVALSGWSGFWKWKMHATAMLARFDAQRAANKAHAEAFIKGFAAEEGE